MGVEIDLLRQKFYTKSIYLDLSKVSKSWQISRLPSTVSVNDEVNICDSI